MFRPDFQLDVRKNNEQKTEVWDPVRKKWIALSPEEFVRQQWICYLNIHFQISYGLMSVEKELIFINGKKRRYDLAVYNTMGKPEVLFEFKAPSVLLNMQIIEQGMHYLEGTGCEILVMSNGENTLILEKQEKGYVSCAEIPFRKK